MSATPTTTAQVTQYGFYFDQGRCHACQVCMIACMNWNGLPLGAPGRWMKVFVTESGTWPQPRVFALAAPCYHCENPVCVDAANGAMYKESKYGAVLIDPAKAKTQAFDLRKANDACPYGAIVFDGDDMNATASKCTMCIDRLETGLLPQCVVSCDTRALEFGPMDELTAKYGNNRQLNGMPDPSISTPAAIFKAQLPQKQIVPYNVNSALTLWQQRGPFAAPDEPLVFGSAGDVTDPAASIIQKNKPFSKMLKWKSNAELEYWTRHDE